MDNIINVSSDQYQKTNTDTVNIRSYQYIQAKLCIDDSFKLFVISVLIGKSLDKSKIPKELPKPTETYTRDTYHINKLYFNILKAVAVDENKDITVLNDMNAMIDIWERYAYAGFNELCDWYYDSKVNIDSKLYEVILTNYEKYIGDITD